MPGAYPKTASLALSNESIKYVKLLVKKGWREAVLESKALKSSVNICLSKVTYKAVAFSHGFKYTSVNELI